MVVAVMVAKVCIFVWVVWVWCAWAAGLVAEVVEATGQVGADVVGVLKAYGQADEVLDYASGLALLFAEFAVRGGGRVGDGGFYVAQVAGDAAKPGLVDEGEGVVADLFWGGIARAGAYAKGEDCTARAALLLHGELVLWVAGQAWVVDVFDLRVLCQPLGDVQGVGALGFDAHGQCF